MSVLNLTEEELRAFVDRISRRVFFAASAPPRVPSRRAWAFHESAHCVLDSLFDCPPNGATISPLAAGIGGLVWYSALQPAELDDSVLDPLPEPSFPDHKFECFVMAARRYAGIQAEYLLADVDPGGVIFGETHDERYAELLLSLAFHNVQTSTAPRGGCQRFARLMLIEHWEQVERIAEALLRHDTLDRAQIVDCLRDPRSSERTHRAADRASVGVPSDAFMTNASAGACVAAAM